jgi:hypothetical protein
VEAEGRVVCVWADCFPVKICQHTSADLPTGGLSYRISAFCKAEGATPGQMLKSWSEVVFETS